MTATCCPRCHGAGVVERDTAAEAEAVTLALREACRAAGSSVTGDDRVDEATAAWLLGKGRKTLSNWRHLERPLAYITRNGRVLYALAELARWMVENGHDPEN